MFLLKQLYIVNCLRLKNSFKTFKEIYFEKCTNMYVQKLYIYFQ